MRMSDKLSLSSTLETENSSHQSRLFTFTNKLKFIGQGGLRTKLKQRLDQLFRLRL
jgi:hypothetical protein